MMEKILYDEDGETWNRALEWLCISILTGDQSLTVQSPEQPKGTFESSLDLSGCLGYILQRSLPIKSILFQLELKVYLLLLTVG